MQTGIPADRQACRQTDGHTDRLPDRLPDSHTDRYDDRRTDGQTDGKAGRQTDRQAGRQAGGHSSYRGHLYLPAGCGIQRTSEVYPQVRYVDMGLTACHRTTDGAPRTNSLAHSWAESPKPYTRTADAGRPGWARPAATQCDRRKGPVEERDSSSLNGGPDTPLLDNWDSAEAAEASVQQGGFEYRARLPFSDVPIASVPPTPNAHTIRTSRSRGPETPLPRESSVSTPPTARTAAGAEGQIRHFPRALSVATTPLVLEGASTLSVRQQWKSMILPG